MSKEEQIKALKNPQERNGLVDNPVGKTMDELSNEELENIQGASDVSPETTPICIGAGIVIGVGISKKVC